MPAFIQKFGNIEVVFLKLYLKGDTRKAGIPDHVVQITPKDDIKNRFWVVPDGEFNVVTMTIDELKEKYQE